MSTTTTGESWSAVRSTIETHLETATNPNHIDALRGVLDATSKETDNEKREGGTQTRGSAGVLLSTVEEREIEWLWEGRLAVGIVTILTGPGGLGKSSYARHLIACVTQSVSNAKSDENTDGWDMPDGKPCLLPGGVITAFMEEPLNEVVVPRLHAAGAEMSLVRDVSKVDGDDGYGGQMKRPFSLSDTKTLEAARLEVGATLLVVDSLTSALGNTSKYASQKIYDTFNALADWAKNAGVSVLIIAHPPGNATPKNPSSFISGSASIFNNVRIVELMVPDQARPEVTMLMNIKNNVHAVCTPLGFHRLPDYRLEFIHGMTPKSSKIQEARRLGDAMMLIKRTLDANVERCYSGQDISAFLAGAGIALEFGTVRSYLTRLVKEQEIQAVPGRRNAYASLLYAPLKGGVQQAQQVQQPIRGEEKEVNDANRHNDIPVPSRGDSSHSIGGGSSPLCHSSNSGHVANVAREEIAQGEEDDRSANSTGMDGDIRSGDALRAVPEDDVAGTRTLLRAALADDDTVVLKPSNGHVSIDQQKAERIV